MWGAARMEKYFECFVNTIFSRIAFLLNFPGNQTIKLFFVGQPRIHATLWFMRFPLFCFFIFWGTFRPQNIILYIFKLSTTMNVMLRKNTPKKVLSHKNLLNCMRNEKSRWHVFFSFIKWLKKVIYEVKFWMKTF